MKITSIKQQVKQANRYSVFVDGKYSFSLSEAALLDSKIFSGQEIAPTELDKLKKMSASDKAFGAALRYVAMRPRSSGEMADYFRRKGVDEPTGQQISERLAGIGLLDDLAFAKAWVASRRLLRHVSVRRLKMELQQKRVSSEIIQNVLAEDTGNDRQTLKDIIEKKRSRYPDTQKLMQHLARQGFSYDDIKAALSVDAQD
jgi:regulatory protein